LEIEMQTITRANNRTWKATAYVMQAGAVIERQGGVFVSATVDGQPTELARVAHLLVWAKTTGILEIVERPERMAHRTEVLLDGDDPDTMLGKFETAP